MSKNKEYIVIPVDGVEEPTSAHIVLNGAKCTNFQVRECKLRKTKEEQAEKRRQYRKEYMNRPINKEKMNQKLQDPEVIAKRRAYAEQDYVKERKKLQNKRSREVKRKLKLMDAKLYEKILNDCEETRLLNEMKEDRAPYVEITSDHPNRDANGVRICGTCP